MNIQKIGNLIPLVNGNALLENSPPTIQGKQAYYIEIQLNDCVQYLPTISLDFDPKGVVYSNPNTASDIRSYLPTNTGKTNTRGFVFSLNFELDFTPEMELIQTAMTKCGACVDTSTDQTTVYVSAIPFTSTYNQSTEKYDIVVGRSDTSSTAYRFIGWAGSYPSQLLFIS